MTDVELSEDEKRTLQEYFDSSGFGAKLPEEKENIHTFLHRVATSEDTTKTSNLTEDELGMAKFPIRSYKSFALLSDKIIRNNYFKDYFDMESEIVTSSSLGRNGFLIKAAITQKKELADTTKKPVVNKGWFKKKDRPQEENLS